AIATTDKSIPARTIDSITPIPNRAISGNWNPIETMLAVDRKTSGTSRENRMNTANAAMIAGTALRSERTSRRKCAMTESTLPFVFSFIIFSLLQAHRFSPGNSFIAWRYLHDHAQQKKETNDYVVPGAWYAQHDQGVLDQFDQQ